MKPASHSSSRAKHIELVSVALIIVALALVLAMVDFGHRYEADFVQNVWMGGCIVLAGSDPYSEEDWDAGKRAALLRDDIFPKYIYPIGVAFLAAPLALFHPMTAFNIWTTISLMSLLGVTIMSIRLTDYARRPGDWLLLTILSLTFLPVWHSLFEGQMNLLLLMLWVSAMASIKHGFAGMGGVVLAITLLKPQSSWLVVAALLWWTLIQRKWGVLIGFTLASLALWVLPTILYPHWIVDWIRVSQWQGPRLVEITPSVWGVSSRIFLYTLSARVIAGGVSLILLASTAWWWVRRAPAAECWGMAPVIVVSLIVSPYGLLYEQTALLIPFWMLWQRSDRVARLFLIGWLVLLPIVLTAILAMNPPWNMVYAVLQPLGLGLFYIRRLTDKVFGSCSV